ncbi:hypothetical protein DVH05_005164 [Phytophthora capsici]|nr:hypothetical protein DVH05_005164 [Phytophthora capsici]
MLGGLRRFTMLSVSVLALLAVQFARGDIEAQLYGNPGVTKPPTPSSLNTALIDLVGTTAIFSEFPSNLQRAMLWSAGLVRVANSNSSSDDSSGVYVQVYVECGRAMSNVFLSPGSFDNTECPLKTCLTNAISYTESSCSPSYVETKALCALNSSTGATFEQSAGPIWSQDGQVDSSFDPQLFQYNSGVDDKTTIYMLAQKGSWIINDDTCPNSAMFIAPCIQVNDSEVERNDNTWCEPKIDQSVEIWVKDSLESLNTDSNPVNTPGSLNTDSNPVNTPAIVGITAACIVVVLVVLGFIIARKRRSSSKQGQTGLWDDDVITASRIPRERIHIGELLSRGAFGEVYAGIFNGQQVAVKMLLPGTRRDIRLVNDFLSEARLTACMEHPRIVTLIGVAWDSLSDLCVVLEFMEGGDLRTLLNNYEKARRPVGFNREKTTIALHVCHALTYLHSLEPSIIHRDLKSRNILLNEMHEAKLTDFGISRERLDRTMTAGVGTSLWMAPEVMMGEKYDDKADMFSFGVVLSELDLHTLPYAQAKREMQHSHGRQLSDATLLQGVANGAITVEFSDVGPQSMVDLGNACVSVDSRNRPTAAEALFTLQVILSKEMNA